MKEFVLIDQADAAQEGSFSDINDAIKHANNETIKNPKRKFWIEQRELVWTTNYGFFQEGD